MIDLLNIKCNTKKMIVKMFKGKKICDKKSIDTQKQVRIRSQYKFEQWVKDRTVRVEGLGFFPGSKKKGCFLIKLFL